MYGGILGFVVGHPNSERTQQDRPDKRKHGEHSQDIQLQGKVHVRPPSLLTMTKVYVGTRGAGMAGVWPAGGGINHSLPLR